MIEMSCKLKLRLQMLQKSIVYALHKIRWQLVTILLSFYLHCESESFKYSPIALQIEVFLLCGLYRQLRKFQLRPRTQSGHHCCCHWHILVSLVICHFHHHHCCLQLEDLMLNHINYDDTYDHLPPQHTNLVLL